MKKKYIELTEEKRIEIEKELDKETFDLYGSSIIDADPVDGDYWFKSTSLDDSKK